MGSRQGDVKDLSLAAVGRKRIDWADQHMPVLRRVREIFARTQPLKGLRLSAETLYTQAGILDPQEAEESDVVKAVMHDPHLSARQREMLIDMYRSFRKVNEAG